MKKLKFFGIILTAVLAFIFAACGAKVDMTSLSGVEPGTPVAADFNFNEEYTFIEGEEIEISIWPKIGKSRGLITIFYEGIGETEYEKSETVPEGAGTYQISFHVAAARPLARSARALTPDWNEADGLIAGTMSIITMAEALEADLAPLPHADQYTITGLGTYYEGDPITVNIIPGANASPGAVTVLYRGIGYTNYTVSSEKPATAGTYDITFNVAEARDNEGNVTWRPRDNMRNNAVGMNTLTILPPEDKPIGTHPNPMRLWYEYPAEDWQTQALPIGNGELGAMFFGGKAREHIQFNEKTLWNGSSGGMDGGYQNFGDLYIDILSHESSAVTDYKRELSISDALGSVSYTADNISYRREYFSSLPDKVIVMRFTSSGNEGSITLSVDLLDGHRAGEINAASNTAKNASGNTITFSGKLNTVSYAARLTVLNEGGTVTAADNKLKIERADAVTFLLAAATNYELTSSNYIGPSADALSASVANTVTAASQKTYASLRNAHLADYRPLFDRVTLNLNEADPGIPTDQLYRTQKNGNYLDMLYFQYGRYLLISSSRGMNIPNNLQGIWRNKNTGDWDSDIHANINIQMNYWPAEVTNLSECHMPFLNFITAMSQRSGGGWQNYARERGANRGWALLTETNIFGWMWAARNDAGNAWYCMHLWQHYLYTLDQNFLRNTAWPSMKSACEFWLDKLVLAADGTYESPQGYSPEQPPYPGRYDENGYFSGVPYDQQLIWDLFNTTLKAGEILGGETDFLAEVKEKFDKLDSGLHLSSDCTGAQLGLINVAGVGMVSPLAEYKYGNTSQHEAQHRHISHLVGLYPGDQITRYYPEFEVNTKASLNGRGDITTGWAMGWRINCWARLRDGNRARTLLKNALNDATKGGGGVYENLFDAHPPFQIDGNFGATSGIAEMLIQSHRGYIEVLPALPNEWSSGKFTGLKAQGNFTIDLEWSNSRPTRCVVYSGSGGELKIRFGGTERVQQTGPGGTYTVSF